MDRLGRMHSAEHILTAVMRSEYGSPRNIEMHLGEKKSKCDYAVPRTLTRDDIAAIEKAVNAEIEAGHPITVQMLPIEEARERYDLWKVPENATSIRIIKIGDFDATPCAGEHVSRSQEIGRFRVKSYDMKDEQIVRIRFTIED